MKRIVSIIALIALTSCASNKPLTQAEKSVRILRKSDAPLECKELKRLHVPGLGFFSEDSRMNELKRKTYRVGGDVAVIIRRDDNMTVYGTAFKCSSS